MIGVLNIYLRNDRSQTWLKCRINRYVDHKNKLIIGFLHNRRIWYIYNNNLYRCNLDMSNIFLTRSYE